MFIKSAAAGFFISVAVFISAIASFSIDNISLSRMAGAAVFSIGLIFCIYAKAKLFTGAVLAFDGVFSRQQKLLAVLRDLSICFIGNMIGSLVCTIILINAAGVLLSSPDIIEYMDTVAQYKMTLMPEQAFLSGIACNIMVCLAVSLYRLHNKIILLALPVFVFVLLGSEHVIANMTYYVLGLSSGSVTSGQVFANMIPVTVGNVIGGIIVVLYFRYINAADKLEK